jgi:biopolymer transport protein ExbB
MNIFLKNLTGYFEAGGFVMPALLALSVVLWWIIFERFIYLFGPLRLFGGWHQGRKTYDLVRIEHAARPFLASGREGAAEDLHRVCANAGGELARFVHRALLEHPIHDSTLLAMSLDEAQAHYGQRVSRRLGLLSVLAMMAPMLGLLGTVSGMIEAFQTMTLAGAADAKALSGGISAALITTQVGLVVALPGLFSRSFFRRRALKLRGDMELLSMRFRNSPGRVSSEDGKEAS